MLPITIVSGCPGTGKTTLSAQLANSYAEGVSLVTDNFYNFLAHRIDPSKPESKTQNEAVVRAFLRSARSFQDDGYRVFVDGVIGPWWLDTICGIIPKFQFVLLHASLDTVLRRTQTRARTQQASANSGLVRAMHAQFSSISDMNTRTILTDGLSPSAVSHTYTAMEQQGLFVYPAG